MPKWTDADIPALHGKTALVTGANSGLGLATAKSLAAHGARVVLAGIGDNATERAIRDIRTHTSDAVVDSLTLDLSDLGSVRTAAEHFQKQHSKLHILINNAGVFGLPYGQTRDGFERVFGINHLGHFAFTNQLADVIRATPGARIVTITSMAHRSGKLPFDDLQWEHRPYSQGGAYSQSKLANLVFALELDRRLRRAHTDAISVAAHPGYSATSIFFAKGVAQPSISRRLWNRIAALGAATWAQPAHIGALPALYAATQEDVQGGQCFGPGGLMEFRGPPKLVKPSARAQDVQIARKLWRHSQNMTGAQWL